MVGEITAQFGKARRSGVDLNAKGEDNVDKRPSKEKTGQTY